MTPEGVLTYLREAATKVPDFVAECGLRDRLAYLRIALPDSPNVWVELSTPGDMWFGLRTMDDFVTIDVTDDPSDSEVRETLEDYVDVARAFLVQRPNPRGRFAPVLTVMTPSGERDLRRSTATNVKAVFRRIARG